MGTPTPAMQAYIAELRAHRAHRGGRAGQGVAAGGTAAAVPTPAPVATHTAPVTAVPAPAAAPPPQPVDLPGGTVTSSPAQLKDDVALLQSKLVGAMGLTGAFVNSRFAAYLAQAQAVLKPYTDRAKREQDMKEAVMGIVLTLPFFVAGNLVGAAMGALVAKFGPVLEEEAAAETDKVMEVFKKGVDMAKAGAQKTLEAGLGKVKDALAKQKIEPGDSIAATMVNVVQGYIDALPVAQTALFDHVRAAKDIYGLAAIYAALDIQTPDVFGQNFRKHIEDFEKQVAPTYQAEQGVGTGPFTSASMSSLMADIGIGGKTYRAQVTKVVSMAPFTTHTSFLFKCWVDVAEGLTETGRSAPIALPPDKVEDVPQAAPPSSALVGGA